MYKFLEVAGKERSYFMGDRPRYNYTVTELNGLTRFSSEARAATLALPHHHTPTHTHTHRHAAHPPHARLPPQVVNGDKQLVIGREQAARTPAHVTVIACMYTRDNGEAPDRPTAEPPPRCARRPAGRRTECC